MSKLVWSALAWVTLAAPPALARQHEPGAAEGHSAGGSAFDVGPRQAPHLLELPASVRFPVATSAPGAADFFVQGVAQLHGFWYLEAERSFRQVAALDPDLGMAYWGMAMASVEDPRRARWFARTAWLKRGLGTERERQWIDALARYYDVEGPEEPKDLVPPDSARDLVSEDDAEQYEDTPAPKGPDKRASERFVKDLEELVWDDPNDLEAKAFLANQIWLNRGLGIETTSRMSVEALLQAIFAVEPMHPAHHYRIHLWDSTETAKRVVDSAVNCGLSWPLVAHNWHMGGHIFAKLGRHADAAFQQEASARVDHAYMTRDWVLPDQIHNFAHNNEWLTRSLRHQGRLAESVELAKNMIELPRHPEYNALDKPRCSASFGRLRLLEALELYEQWGPLADVAGTMYLEPGDESTDGAARAFALGKASLFLGDHDRYDHSSPSSSARSARSFRALGRSRSRRGEGLAAGKSGEDVKVAMQKALARYGRELDKLRSQRAALVALDNVLAGAAVVENLAVLKDKGFDKALLARLMAEHGLAADDRGLIDDAVALARDAIKGRDGQLVEHATLAYVLHVSGAEEEALEVFDRVRASSALADISLPVFERLAPLAEARGFKGDWRPAFEVASDVGERIDLDLLGPAHWSPPKAPAWRMVDTFGREHALADWHGRPVLVVFFLGFGCVHCMEQLKELGPRTGEFRAAGIDVVTVGLQSPEELAPSVGSDPDDTGYPFHILADPSLANFKAYRAYDDFEGEPLHGTYLIDGEGYVRWLDISHEPFMNIQFLLEECTRLLALPVRGSETERTVHVPPAATLNGPPDGHPNGPGGGSGSESGSE
ncbi:MAG: redoxin domain-containing protein [Planctomycetota bacterium]